MTLFVDANIKNVFSLNVYLIIKEMYPNQILLFLVYDIYTQKIICMSQFTLQKLKHVMLCFHTGTIIYFKLVEQYQALNKVCHYYLQYGIYL